MNLLTFGTGEQALSVQAPEKRGISASLKAAGDVMLSV